MPTRVLFLPGASGAGAFWRPVVDLLPADWHMACVDWPGLGDVPPDPAIRTFEDLVELVLSRVSEPVDLVAQSMGGVVAVRAALRRPDRVRRLVLVATSGGLNLARLGAEDWRPSYRAEYPAAPAWITDSGSDLSDELPGLQAPTLLIWGGADTLSPPGVGEYLESRLPWARLIVVPDADHMFARDRAADVAPLIRAHLVG
jgi:pimeloyl-ACP methyl ester carboxylesterase